MVACSVICSNHFIWNKRSNDPRSPSSIPSIFPNVYKKKKTDSKQADDRYKRKLCRDMQSTSFLEEQQSSVSLVENISITQFVTVGTKITFNNSDNQNFIFSCTYDGNNVSTQHAFLSLQTI